ncbi:MAG: hypothetical protein CM1200mP3_11570 [Chloroflexota bacterium]|nr:MAG: hypothetical protein CM1200mP3_11570 [Chloroflexota bacterium]
MGYSRRISPNPGKVVRRDEWRLVIPGHVSDTRQQARDEIRYGSAKFLRDYSEGTNGREPVFTGPETRLWTGWLTTAIG